MLVTTDYSAMCVCVCVYIYIYDCVQYVYLYTVYIYMVDHITQFDLHTTVRYPTNTYVGVCQYLCI
jgi:hypothetical protein